MKPLTLVVAQHDPHNAEALALTLQSHFKGVTLAHDLEELRRAILQNRCDVAVVDLEMAPLAEVDRLRREFNNLDVVCTHRLADDRLWTEALSAGAVDCCHPSDVRGIVLAANRTSIMARTTAA